LPAGHRFEDDAVLLVGSGVSHGGFGEDPEGGDAPADQDARSFEALAHAAVLVIGGARDALDGLQGLVPRPEDDLQFSLISECHGVGRGGPTRIFGTAGRFLIRILLLVNVQNMRFDGFLRIEYSYVDDAPRVADPNRRFKGTPGPPASRKEHRCAEPSRRTQGQRLGRQATRQGDSGF
jgi:hypothetical protein